MRNLSSLLLLGLLLYPPALMAQAYSPEVDTAEVIRRGNHVEHVSGFQAEPDIAFSDAIATPADDSHKWFISVYSISNCGPCTRLKADWATSQHLQAFAKPGDQKGSWAHLNFYNAEDETQNFRLKNLRVRGYPLIVIQPPRSLAYGDPSTVVMQKSGYNGKPEELAALISAKIKDYVKTYESQKHSSVTPVRTTSFSSARGFGQVGRDRSPPFVVPSPIAPAPNPSLTPPLVVPGPLDPDVQPSPTPAPPDAPAPAPKTPESVMARGSICVVVDSNSIAEAEHKMAGRKRLLDFLRAKNPGVDPQIITTEQAKAKFPTLDTTEPQVIMTGLGGKLVSQIPQSIIDKLLEDQPELQTVGTVVKTIGAVIPTVPQLVLFGGFGAFLYWRKSRKTASVNPVDPNAPTPTPAPAANDVVQQVLDAIRSMKKE